MATDSKPVYKRWWFIVLGTLVVLLIIGSLLPKEPATSPTSERTTDMDAKTASDLQMLDSIAAASFPDKGLGISREDIVREFAKEGVDISFETWKPIGGQPYKNASVPGFVATNITSIGPDGDLFEAHYSTSDAVRNDVKDATARSLLLRFAKLVDPNAEGWAKKVIAGTTLGDGSEMKLEEAEFGKKHLELRYSGAMLDLLAKAKK